MRWRVTTEKEDIMEKELLLGAGGRADIEGSKRGPQGPTKCLRYKEYSVERRDVLGNI